MANLSDLRKRTARWTSVLSRLITAVMPQTEPVADLGKKNVDNTGKGYMAAQTHYSADAFAFFSPRIIRHLIVVEKAAITATMAATAQLSPTDFCKLLVTTLSDDKAQEYASYLATVIQISPATGDEQKMDNQIAAAGYSTDEFRFFYTPKAALRGSGAQDSAIKAILNLFAAGVTEFPSVVVAAPVVPKPVFIEQPNVQAKSRVDKVSLDDLFAAATPPAIKLVIADPNAGVTATDVTTFYDTNAFANLAAARKLLTDKGITVAATANRAQVEALMLTNSDKFV